MEENTVVAAEDTEMEDCDGQKVVTMMDVLKEQEDFENNANAVLGASDEKNCTFSKGYIKRQAIYACLTCCSGAKDDPSKRAGVCLACSLTCHENHELIELYTKRNFRCDCGNPKFNSNPCQYTSTKPDLNENNEYNQNFCGLYCVCHRPYPDPESTLEDEMIQCIICEDWLHSTHLESAVPSNDQYSEMICKGCMEKNSFLHDYSSLAVNIENDVDVVVDTTEITTCNGNYKDSESNKIDETEKCIENDNESNMNESDVCNLTSQTLEDSNAINSNIEKQEQSSDTTKEQPQHEDEHMEEDRLLADPEEENKLKNNEIPGNINTSEPLAVKDDENKEQNEHPSINIQENEVQGGETNNDKAGGETTKNDAYLETKKDNNDETCELSSSNEIKETNKELGSEAEVGQTQPEDKKEIIASNVLDMGTEKKDEDLKNGNTIETNVNTKISDDKEISENIESKNNADLENKNTNTETTNKYEDSTSEYKRKLPIEENIDDSTISEKRAKLDTCCMRPRNVRKIYKGATFWPSDFRQKLCTCNECLTMYKDLSVLFLTDFDDTVTAYESLGEEKERIEGKPATQYEKGLQALSSLDRVQQINALTEYNKMKDKLLDFLKTFKERKEVVKEEDIKEFFAGMKPKREPDGVYFCR